MSTSTSGDADLSRVAGLIGDPARSRMLMALTGGREVSASLLADEAGVGRPTASAHLRKLVDGGLVAVRAAGRHRHYRIADDRVADALERLLELAPPQPVTSLRASTRAARLRVARTCYDHVAGRLGVAVMGSLIDAGHLAGGDGRLDPAAEGDDRPAAYGQDVDYRLTDSGRDFLDDLGVRLPEGRRPLVRYCVDWTETRHHLAGRLGAGLLDHFLDAGWVRRHETHRALLVTDAGTEALGRDLGVDLAS